MGVIIKGGVGYSGGFKFSLGTLREVLLRRWY